MTIDKPVELKNFKLLLNASVFILILLDGEIVRTVI